MQTRQSSTRSDLFLGMHRVSLLHKAILLGDKLVLADPHFGKTAHFRKAGLPIPPHARDYDYQRLTDLIVQHRPSEVIILGDLFHSEYNGEWMMFQQLIQRFRSHRFILVKGNHDIMEEHHYEAAGLFYTDFIELDGLLLTHEPVEAGPNGSINIHGHIHPGIRLSGKGRQHISAPCFHLTSTHFCLPAFGHLTGLAMCRPKSGDRIYAIVDEHILDVSAF